MQLEAITIEQLADILAVSTIHSTINHAGMLAHEVTHPNIGKVTTIQGDDGAFLIKA